MNPLASTNTRQARTATRPRLGGFAIIALTVTLLLMSGCGKSAPPGGDPGNKRLNELSHDPIFAVLPPGATNVHVTRTPANYTQPPFQTGGWNGPSVEVTFRSSAPIANVYHFYARRAAATGWHALKRNVNGVIVSWNKTYPDRAQAWLSLWSDSPSTYSLEGSIASIVG